MKSTEVEEAGDKVSVPLMVMLSDGDAELNDKIEITVVVSFPLLLTMPAPEVVEPLIAVIGGRD